MKYGLYKRGAYLLAKNYKTSKWISIAREQLKESLNRFEKNLKFSIICSYSYIL